VADYVRYRPSYPAAFYELLREQIGLNGQPVPIADLGSGTGISAKPLLDMGAKVYCVEPNDAMRAAAESLLGEYRCFKSVAGTAENTTLPSNSIALILCAQAFHWFDKAKARAEFARISKPGNPVVLVWNNRRLDATPLLRDYESLLKQFGTDYQKVRHENVDHSALSEFFSPSDYVEFTFDNVQEFDYAGLEGRLKSSSYTPPPGDPRYQPMIDDLRRIFDQYQADGRVRFEYETRAFIGPISAEWR
jgi:SAM-dependent methyltransferase